MVNRLTLVTFNAGLLQLKCLGINWYKNPPFTSRRVRQIPTALRSTEADIICLQEIFDGSHAKYITDSVCYVYPYSSRTAAAGVRGGLCTRVCHSMFALHNGLLTLSKYPIEHTAYYPFESITWSERMFGSKGVLKSVINVPSVGALAILNVHMVSGTVDPESRTLDDIRLKEMHQILALADEAAALGQIPIIVGDFNAGPSVCPSSYLHLLDLGWKDAFVAGRLKVLSDTPQESFLSAGGYPSLIHAVTSTHDGPPTPTQQSKPTDLDLSSSASSSTELPLVAPFTFDPLAAQTLPLFSYNNPVGTRLIEGKLVKKKRTTALMRALAEAPPAAALEIAATTVPNVPATGSPGRASRGWSTPGANFVKKNWQRLSSTKEHVTRLLDKSSVHTENDDQLGWTWNPKNPLNMLGPHANCHGLRCDHLFLPPMHLARTLNSFRCAYSNIIFHQPRVLVYSRWVKNCFCAPFHSCFASSSEGNSSASDSRAPLLVTLSDHHAVKVVLERSV